MNKPEAKVTQVDALIHEKLMQVVLIHSMLEFWKYLNPNKLNKNESKVLKIDLCIILLPKIKTLNPIKCNFQKNISS